MILFSSRTAPAFPEVAAEMASKTVLIGVMKTCVTRLRGFGKAEKCLCRETSLKVMALSTGSFTILECRIGKG